VEKGRTVGSTNGAHTRLGALGADNSRGRSQMRAQRAHTARLETIHGQSHHIIHVPSPRRQFGTTAYLVRVLPLLRPSPLVQSITIAHPVLR
jgi:hypothetical protein